MKAKAKVQILFKSYNNDRKEGLWNQVLVYLKSAHITELLAFSTYILFHAYKHQVLTDEM